MSGDLLVVTARAWGATGIWQVEAMDAAKHSAMYGTASRCQQC